MPNYYPYQQNYQPFPQSQQPTSSLIWVQGEGGAKSYLVGAGQSVLLMDAEGSTFYIKSTDASGMPMPLRVFDYKERTQTIQQSGLQNGNYVTHEELEKWTKDLLDKIKPQEGA